jgi:hypothetical protein
LKYGKTIAMAVVDATYAVRKHSRKRLKWRGGNNGSLKVWKLFTKPLLGNFLLNQLSINANTGWLYICKQNIKIHKPWANW